LKISITLTGMLASSMGYKRKVIEVSDKTTIRKLLELLVLPIKTEWLAVSVNGVLKDKKKQLNDGDDVFIMPAGGAG